jgi:hypothetical protein
MIIPAAASCTAGGTVSSFIIAKILSSAAGERSRARSISSRFSRARPPAFGDRPPGSHRPSGSLCGGRISTVLPTYLTYHYSLSLLNRPRGGRWSAASNWGRVPTPEGYGGECEHPRWKGLEARRKGGGSALEVHSAPSFVGSRTSRWRSFEGGPFVSTWISSRLRSRSIARAKSALLAPLLSGCLANTDGA